MKIAHHHSFSARIRAFSLLEVMIAAGIFFMCVFSILAVVSGGLRNARLLQSVEVDCSMLAAELSATNRLTEGSASGDFGKNYRDYRWSQDRYEVGTNGLYQVDFVVTHTPTKRESKMSVLFYKPDSGALGRIGR